MTLPRHIVPLRYLASLPQIAVSAALFGTTCLIVSAVSLWDSFTTRMVSQVTLLVPEPTVWHAASAKLPQRMLPSLIPLFNSIFDLPFDFCLVCGRAIDAAFPINSSDGHYGHGDDADPSANRAEEECDERHQVPRSMMCLMIQNAATPAAMTMTAAIA